MWYSEFWRKIQIVPFPILQEWTGVNFYTLVPQALEPVRSLSIVSKIPMLNSCQKLIEDRRANLTHGFGSISWTWFHSLSSKLKDGAVSWLWDISHVSFRVNLQRQFPSVSFFVDFWLLGAQFVWRGPPLNRNVAWRPWSDACRNTKNGHVTCKNKNVSPSPTCR